MSDVNELFPPGPPTWTVATRYKYQTKKEREAKEPQEETHHELLYGTKVQQKRKGHQGLEGLRELAKHCNKMKLVPRPAIQCAADAPNLDTYLKKHTP